MSNENSPQDPQVESADSGDDAEFSSKSGGKISLRTLGLLIGTVLVVDVLAFFLVPPLDVKNPGEACAGYNPVCLVEGTLHLPRPEEVWIAGGQEAARGLITFQVSLTNSLVTMLGLTILVLVLSWLASLGRRMVPGFFQNFVEWAYESLTSFGKGMGGGQKSLPYIPLFASFFVLILVFNWSGLVPPVGLLRGLRAPTSDLNVTIGLAMVAFFTFHIEGFRVLGARGYLSKFFPFYEFKQGIGAGLIAMFVGFMELFLEFIKPVTLSMRLFGNTFGGEVAIGVVTGLFIALVPIALYGLEIILTFVQALIFSTLTLMFVLAAVESHHHAEGDIGEEAVDTLKDAQYQSPAASH
ncbi:MAG: F0F1 ATP synthase subunit A [Chloroflexota bacterium]